MGSTISYSGEPPIHKHRIKKGDYDQFTRNFGGQTSF
jgi:hypothetical protein